MPLYEAQGFALAKRSSLTPEQQHEQHAALLGVRIERTPLPMNALSPDAAAALQLTPEQVEQMRELVLQNDSKRANETREFDLNSPKLPPYKHQEFPTTVYNHANGKNRIVKTAAELEKLLAAGWERKPAAPLAAAVKTETDDESDDELIAAKPRAAKRAAR